MRGIQAFWWLMVVTAVGCNDSLPAAPVPTAISPGFTLVGVPVDVVIAGTGFVPRVRTDFNGQGTIDSTFRAFVGDVELTSVVFQEDGSLRGTVPGTLGAGTHSVRVVDPSGREGTLSDAFVADAVSSFRFATVGPQQTGVPFTLELHALDAAGDVVSGFTGSVALSSSTGEQLTVGPFVAGVWSGQVRVDSAHPSVTLTVTDSFSRTGTSNAFEVLGFGSLSLTGVADGVAGACLGPLTIQRRDTSGAPLPSELPLSLALGVSNLVSAQAYTSASCATVVNGLDMPPGAASVQIYVRGTRVGSGEVHASAAGAPQVSVPVTISVGPTSSVVFLSAPQTVAVRTCSSLVRIALADAFGNSVDAGSTATVALAVGGLEAFGFFSDSGCTSPVTSVVFDGSAAEESFYFGGSAPGTAEVRASIGDFAPSTQQQTLTGSAPNFAYFTSVQTLPAGRCSTQIRIGTVIGGNPTPLMADARIALQAAPAGGLQFFSDAGCATPITGVTIARGQSETSFFVKGTVGGNFGVDAIAGGFSTVRQTETILPMTRQIISCLFPDSATSVACSFGPAVTDLSKTLVTYAVTSSSAEPLDGQVRCKLTALNALTCVRQGSGGAATVTGYVTEFASGVSTAVYEPPCPSPATDFTFTLPSPVVPSKTFSLFALTEKGVSNSLNDFTMVQLQDEDTVRFRYEVTAATPDTCSDDGAYGAYLHVVQGDFFTVTRGVTPAMTGGALAVTGLSAAPRSSSILLYSWRSSGTGFEMCERMLRGELDSDTSILFSRGNGAAGTACTADPVEGISWERVDFGARARVQQVEVLIPAGALSNVITLPSAVDLTRSIVLTGGQFSRGQSAGEGTLSTTDTPGAMIARLRLSNAGTTLDADRGFTGGDSRFTAYVVEFVP